VEGGASRTDAAVATIEDQLGELPQRVQTTKRDLLDAAEETASSLTQYYFTMGMFAVSAGVLLLVNIFVMLSDDRRSELGMLRALGLRRLRLVAALRPRAGCTPSQRPVLGAIRRHRCRKGDRLAERIRSAGAQVFRLDLTLRVPLATVRRDSCSGLVVAHHDRGHQHGEPPERHRGTIATCVGRRRKPRRRWMRAARCCSSSAQRGQCCR
jgi:hypothetical protein